MRLFDSFLSARLKPIPNAMAIPRPIIPIMNNIIATMGFIPKAFAPSLFCSNAVICSSLAPMSLSMITCPSAVICSSLTPICCRAVISSSSTPSSCRAITWSSVSFVSGYSWRKHLAYCGQRNEQYHKPSYRTAE